MLRKFLDLLMVVVAMASGLTYNSMVKSAQPVQSILSAPAVGQPGYVAPIPGSAPDTIPELQATKQKDVDVMLVIDNSGSMFGYTCNERKPIQANDAEARRIRGAQIVIAALAADLKPRETKLGIVSFGTTAEKISELKQLSNTDSTVREELSRAIETPGCKGDTNIVDAIKLAQEELRSERHRPDNIPAIIFLTDGVPTSGGRELEIEYLLAELKDVQFYTILLGESDQFNQFKGFWQEQADKNPNVTVDVLSTNNGIENIYSRIKADLNGTDNAAEGRPQLPPGPTVQVPMPGNVKQAVFTVIKASSDTSVSIQDPQSKDARQRPADRFVYLDNKSTIDVFVVDRPEAGNWVFSSSDGTMMTILQPDLKSVYEVQVVQPDAQGLLAVDEPTTIIVQVIDSETKQPLKGPFTFNSTYRQAGDLISNSQNLVFTATTTPDQYSIQLPKGTFADSTNYIFGFEAQDGGGLRSNVVEYQLSAGLIPAIFSVINPNRVYVDEAATIVVKTVNSGSVEGQVVPQILQAPPTNTAVNLTAQTTNTFQTTLQDFDRPGDYILNIQYTGKTKSGRPFSDSRTVSFTVLERASTIWLRNSLLALLVLSVGFLIFKYLLLSPLIPLLQKMGISPKGYIRLVASDSSGSDVQSSITDLLRTRRRIRKLTIGPDGDIKPPIVEDLSSYAGTLPSDDDEEVKKQPKPGLRQRVAGKRNEAVITRRLGSKTYIKKMTGGRTEFSNSMNSVALKDCTVEYSLKSLEPEPDNNPY